VRTLTVKELNRALLARQLLLHRHRLSVPKAIERVGALQAQWPPSPYIALWSRLEGFRREKLMRSIERRSVVKATLMRGTLHHVSAADYLAYAGLFREARLDAIEQRLKQAGIDLDFDRLTRQLLGHLADGPLPRPELLRLLDQPKLVTSDRRPWLVWHMLSTRAGLVHGPSSSVWRLYTGRGTFTPAESWLGRRPKSGAEAAASLVRRYLAAFGPATRNDVTRWTRLPVGALAPAFERLRLRRFRDEDDRELLDVPRAPLPPAETPAPPRLLPMWDSSLLAHDDRSRILPDRYRKTVILANGDVLQTFLVDGFVAGTWELEDGRVRFEPFERLTRRVERELRREANDLVTFAA
jgi:Winged helix DNA-binding domain